MKENEIMKMKEKILIIIWLYNVILCVLLIYM